MQIVALFLHCLNNCYNKSNDSIKLTKIEDSLNCSLKNKEFDGIKGVFRNHNSKKDRQYKSQKKGTKNNKQ